MYYVDLPHGTNAVPSQPGNYVITVGPDNTPVYVGQASDLKARTLEHLGTNEKNPCVAREIRKPGARLFYQVAHSQRERDAVENEWCAKYSPACNRISPPSPFGR